MKKPFFNKFLVDQNQHNTKQNEASIKGGFPFPPPAVTHKWPSDDDEDGIYY